MKLRPKPKTRSFTFTLLGLILLALIILSSILAGYDCYLAGGTFVRTINRSYACVNTLQTRIAK